MTLAPVLLAGVLLGGGLPNTTTPLGFGSAATGGGACGTVVNVTTLADAGAGSLRAAIEGEQDDRCVRFTVPGDVCLASELRATGDNVTLDCSTAPRGGVAITCRGIYLGDEGLPADNWIQKHCRYRRGDGPAETSLVINNGDDHWIDHGSFIYGADDNFDIFAVWVGATAHRITISNSIFAHAMGCEDQLGPVTCEQDVGAPLDLHNLNALVGGNVTEISWHRNIFALVGKRNPDIAAGQEAGCCPGGVPDTGVGSFELIQNVYHGIVDSANLASESWSFRMDVLHNVFLSSTQAYQPIDNYPIDSGSLAFPSNSYQFYARGNVEGSIGSLSAPSADQNNIMGAYGVSMSTRPDYVAPARIAQHWIPQGDSEDALEIVLQDAGATLPCADALDERVKRAIRNGNGRWVLTNEDEAGGLPDLTKMQSAACGWVNRRVDAANISGNGATNTEITMAASCTDPDSAAGAPLAKHYYIVTQPSSGSARVSGSNIIFNATGVSPGNYPFTYECSDGASEDTATATPTVNP
jgi:pectate lyase